MLAVMFWAVFGPVLVILACVAWLWLLWHLARVLTRS
jgi:hypothetical protein